MPYSFLSCYYVCTYAYRHFFSTTRHIKGTHKKQQTFPPVMAAFLQEYAFFIFYINRILILLCVKHRNLMKTNSGILLINVTTVCYFLKLNTELQLWISNWLLSVTQYSFSNQKHTQCCYGNFIHCFWNAVYFFNSMKILCLVLKEIIVNHCKEEGCITVKMGSICK